MEWSRSRAALFKGYCLKPEGSAQMIKGAGMGRRRGGGVVTKKRAGRDEILPHHGSFNQIRFP